MVVKCLSQQTRNDVNTIIPQLLQPLIQQIMTYEKKANVFETAHFQQLYRICSSNIKVWFIDDKYSDFDVFERNKCGLRDTV